MPKNDRGTNCVNDIELRPVSDKDEEFLLQLYIGLRSGEFAATGWNEGQISQLLKTQYQYQKQSYGMQFPDAEHYTILVEGERIGRIIVNRTDKEIRLVDISISKEFRNNGRGTALVSALKEEAVKRRVAVVLSVAVDNPQAFRLYEKLGFKKTGSDDVCVSMKWAK